ncbi:MAG: hypothetical protein HC815_15070 [Richelia sp. RM1_1_1]|nr:hypothetical protein [Richelia sp. RM1_1_1]
MVIEKFASRAIRKISTNKKIRKFIPKAGAIQKKNKGLFSQLWNGFAKFSVSLLSGVWKALSSGFSWSFTALMGVIHASKEFILNFNWNPSDAQLDLNIKNAFDSIPGAIGQFLGKAAGYLTCGALPGAVIFAFNQPMGAYVLEELGMEALEELTGSLANLIRVTATSFRQAVFAYTHKQLRTLWRESDSKFRKRLQATGLKKQFIDKAIAERNKPFIIRSILDKKVESIKSKPLKSFVENFLEEFDETCIEAGYVIAGGLDTYIAQKNLEKVTERNSTKNIEVEVQENGSVTLKEFKPATTT